MYDIPRYDLLPNNSLFHNDFTSKPVKYMIAKKLKEYLINENNIQPRENTALVVDFLSLVRLIPMGQLSTFQDVLNGNISSTRKYIKFEFESD